MNINKLGLVAITAATIMTPFTTCVLADVGDTTVTYTVETSYNWIIPSTTQGESTMALDDTTKTGTVGVTGVSIPADKKLVVTAKGDGTDDAFTMKLNTVEMPYTVKVGTSETALAVNGEVLSYVSGEDTGTEKSVELKFDVAKAADVTYSAGTYTGHMIFTATLTDK